MGEVLEKPLKANQSLITGGGILPDPVGDKITGLFGTTEGVLPDLTPPPVQGPQTLLNPSTMPSLTSADQRDAKRRSVASQLARKGRASTILTQDDGLGAAG